MGFRASLIAASFLAGCVASSGHRPEIVKGIDWNTTVPHAEFTARLRQRYPAGSSEAALIAELQREGFTIKRDDTSASTDWGGYPCLYFVSVDWSAADGRVANIEGVYTTACT
ncbi:MAG: hypothetical protein ABUS57_11395 [Pseudomonadota bacterium]